MREMKQRLMTIEEQLQRFQNEDHDEVSWKKLTLFMLIQCNYYRRRPKLTLSILDSSISSKLFSLEV
jgi:hypothetical protein